MAEARFKFSHSFAISAPVAAAQHLEESSFFFEKLMLQVNLRPELRLTSLATADWVVMGLYVALMAAIGVWSYGKVARAEDFFAAGGKMPWWLAGISHHMSGYSGAVFVAYAGVAYTYGFTLYVWWALSRSEEHTSELQSLAY